VKMRLAIACLGMLFPLLGVACGLKCERDFARLVRYRTEAITTAFGDLYALLPNDIAIKFITERDPEYARFWEGKAFDPQQRTLLFPQEFILMRMPEYLPGAVEYWPYYQDAYVRKRYPVIEAIDNVLWGIYLQQEAQVRGLSWPPADCFAVDIPKRLACKMLTGGIAESVKSRPMPLFNGNRLDRILPSDFTGFRRRVLRTDREYHDVQRYGGILLVGPLITEFGVRRMLSYFAQTPFRIEDDDLQGSVLRYQERARRALTPALEGSE
jgi:hypothetical protein